MGLRRAGRGRPRGDRAYRCQMGLGHYLGGPGRLWPQVGMDDGGCERDSGTRRNQGTDYSIVGHSKACSNGAFSPHSEAGRPGRQPQMPVCPRIARPARPKPRCFDARMFSSATALRQATEDAIGLCQAACGAKTCAAHGNTHRPEAFRAHGIRALRTRVCPASRGPLGLSPRPAGV